ncbi:hypothetical protein ACA910_009820 [Epithemia clementina (nom. ined.)]
MVATSWLGFIVALILLAMPELVTTSTRCKEINKGCHNLSCSFQGPPTLNWRHKAVFVEAGSDTKVLGHDENDPIPLGIPFEFETSLFKGMALLRFRNAESDDKTSHVFYFNSRKRLIQIVIQGQFKRRLKMSELYIGGIFEQPLAYPPPPSFSKIIEAIFRRVAPGVIFDLGSSKPRVLALYAGSAQTLSIDAPGKQPDIMQRDLPENVHASLGNKFSSKSKRRKVLSSPKRAEEFEFDTNHVYTFHSYDDAMDYGRGAIRMPIYGDFDIKPFVGKQPFPISVVTSAGDTLFSSIIWHQDTVDTLDP